MSVLISNDAELLTYVDEDEMHERNREWRGIDRATDVLSFECDSAFDEYIPMEAIVELGADKLHPLAKRAKDIAAASVYVLSITAAIVGILVFAHAFGLVVPLH